MALIMQTVRNTTSTLEARSLSIEDKKVLTGMKRNRKRWAAILTRKLELPSRTYRGCLSNSGLKKRLEENGSLPTTKKKLKKSQNSSLTTPKSFKNSKKDFLVGWSCKPRISPKTQDPTLGYPISMYEEATNA
eukprot:GHVP01002909.1.p2 GENE.GHVP01002909.1~~GHVP01002909.1.p2  ORF type:complete len:133 (+),score=22.50 GHVP01002909.1:476-874(+)